MKFLVLFLATVFSAVLGIHATPVVHTKKIFPLHEASSGVTRARSVKISYHGGPIMLGTVNTYAIFYGSWPSTCDQAILTTFLSGISSNAYFNIEKTYHDGSGHYVSGPVVFRQSTTDSYSLGTSLGDSDILTIVQNQITSGVFPLDTNAVYFVYTSPDVSETSGFCSQYCGWHTNGAVNGQDIKYSFIGNPSSCLAGCSPNNQNVSPNGNPGVDAMVSVTAHELMEAISDPDLNAWYDATGQENADKCAYKYGTTSTLSSGAIYNVAFGGHQYLIQQNWDATSQSCLTSA